MIKLELEKPERRMPMKRLYRYCLNTMVMLVAMLCVATVSWSAIIIQDVIPSDVTPSGFAVIWQTSEYAVPGISIFSDPDGTTEITSQLEITPLPLYSGNPGIAGEYEQEAELENLRLMAKSNGLMKIRVAGCLPQTTYYYRISSAGAGGEVAVWPAGTLPSVTTTRENSFIADSKQLLVTVDDQGGAINPAGWLVSGAEVPPVGGEALFGVSSYVGDGAAVNQAYINLSNLFGADGLNWTLSGTREIILEIRRGWGSTTVYKTISLDFSNNFSVSSVIEILTEPDTDNDGIPDPWEISNFGDLTTVGLTTDFDGDGLLDIDEYSNNTDPKDSDSDGDGMPDGYEVANSLDPLDDGSIDPNNGPDGDPDGDAHTNIDEHLAGSSSNDINSRPVDINIALHKGLNIFGYPVTESTGLTSFELLTLAGDNTEIEKILVYDKINNIYKEVFYDGTGPAGDSIAIGFGDGIMVYSMVDKTISFNPVIRPFNSYIECAPVDLAAGLNVTTFPCVPSGYTSYTLLADIRVAGGDTSVSSLQRYNPGTGEFDTAAYHNGQLIGVDFPIVAGEGYFIYMKQGLAGFSP